MKYFIMLLVAFSFALHSCSSGPESKSFVQNSSSRATLITIFENGLVRVNDEIFRDESDSSCGMLIWSLVGENLVNLAFIDSSDLNMPWPMLRLITKENVDSTGCKRLKVYYFSLTDDGDINIFSIHSFEEYDLLAFFKPDLAILVGPEEVNYSQMLLKTAPKNLIFGVADPEVVFKGDTLIVIWGDTCSDERSWVLRTRTEEKGWTTTYYYEFDEL